MTSPVTATLSPGLKGHTHAVVTEAMTAPQVGSGTVHVLATPMMVALMEAAAVQCVEHLLPAGHASLGTHLDVAHIAPTPPGIEVTATAELVAVDGRKLTFRIDASDARQLIGRATHTRIVVDTHRFAERLAAKSS